jgi:HEAT repeat protein
VIFNALAAVLTAPMNFDTYRRPAVAQSKRLIFTSAILWTLFLTIPPAVAQTPAAPPPPSATDAEPHPGAASAKSHTVEAWDILSTGVNNRNALRRAEAVVALGTAGSQKRVVRMVEHALDDSDPSIRELAAKSLGEMRARSSIPQLTKALTDESPDVSFAAAKALWSMGNRSGRDVFLQILSGEKNSSGGVMKSGLIKNEFQGARKKFDDPKSLAVLGAKEAASSLFGPAGWGIKIMEEITQDRSASARATSALLLGPDATLDTLHQLQDALNDKNWIVRAAAAQALGASRHRDQVPYLQPLLEDSKPAVRCMAAAAIVRLSAGPAAITPAQGPSAAEVHPAFDPATQKSLQ